MRNGDQSHGTSLQRGQRWILASGTTSAIPHLRVLQHVDDLLLAETELFGEMAGPSTAAVSKDNGLTQGPPLSRVAFFLESLHLIRKADWLTCGGGPKHAEHPCRQQHP
jgi:hypothetical protein